MTNEEKLTQFRDDLLKLAEDPIALDGIRWWCAFSEAEITEGLSTKAYARLLFYGESDFSPRNRWSIEECLDDIFFDIDSYYESDLDDHLTMLSNELADCVDTVRRDAKWAADRASSPGKGIT